MASMCRGKRALTWQVPLEWLAARSAVALFNGVARMCVEISNSCV